MTYGNTQYKIQTILFHSPPSQYNNTQFSVSS